MHAHARHLHARRYARIHTHTHTHTHTHIHTHTLTCTHACMSTHLLISVSEVSFPGMVDVLCTLLPLSAASQSNHCQVMSSLLVQPLYHSYFTDPQWMAPPNLKPWIRITLQKNPVGKNEHTFTHSGIGAHWEVTKGTVCGY